MTVCLVTGGAGFIGSHLVEELVARGCSVRVLDDFSTGSIENLAEVEDRVELVRGSVMDFDAVREAAAGVEYVFHLAAPPPGETSLADPLAAHHCGATGTLHLNRAGTPGSPCRKYRCAQELSAPARASRSRSPAIRSPPRESPCTPAATTC